MSLFGTLQMASNSLRANQVALQVVGQNIANANTPGYIREEVVLTPAPTQRMGSLLMGLGVEVEAVVQKLDAFLEERLRGSVSEKASAQSREDAFVRLEEQVGELSDTDLSTALTGFFNSISEVLNQPESASVRNLAVLKGVALTQQMRALNSRVRELRADADGRVGNIGEEMNRLIGEVRDLNVRIAETEGGDATASDAVGLRDQRLEALEGLAKLLDIRVKEQPSGAVTVYAGGDYLVADGVARFVKVVHGTENGLPKTEIRLAETDSLLQPAGGELHGQTSSRDEVFGGFLDQLDNFAATLAFEFNKLYSGGQGLNGFRALTSHSAVTADDVPLDEAGLPFTPRTGSFQVMTYLTVDGKKVRQKTTDVLVDLTGQGNDTTLGALAAALDAIDGVSAEINPEGTLTVTAESSDGEFAFAGDTSGVLAALGLNTFFTGSTSADLGVDPAVRQDPAKFAASRGGLGADTQNAVELAKLLDRALPSQNGASLSVLYDRMAAEAAQGSAAAKAASEGAGVFEQTLRGQKLATSGVSLDEEAVRMIQFQKSYQASARLIAVLQEMFDTLVNL